MRKLIIAGCVVATMLGGYACTKSSDLSPGDTSASARTGAVQSGSATGPHSGTGGPGTPPPGPPHSGTATDPHSGTNTPPHSGTGGPGTPPPGPPHSGTATPPHSGTGTPPGPGPKHG